MPRICFVSEHRAPFRQEEATRFRLAGWEVHAITADDTTAESPQLVELAAFNRVEAIQRSERLWRHLQQWHERQPLQAVMFEKSGGLGFRTVQAKRCGLGLDGCVVGVLDGGVAVDLETRWQDPLAGLRQDFIERYAWEGADITLADPELAAKAVLGEKARVAEDDRPLVSLVLITHDMGSWLQDALESVAKQDYPHLEVILVDDGSTDQASLAVWEALKVRYPACVFLRQSNQGANAARNAGLARAAGEYVVLMDADNVAAPQMVSRMVRAMQHRPQVAALTTFFAAFAEGEDLVQGNYLYAYRPPGGPIAMGCFENVFGDTNAIYRTADLRAIGGYDAANPRLGFQDWDTFARLALGGRQVDVIPDYLFYYRHREGSVSRSTNRFCSQQRVIGRYVGWESISPSERTALWQGFAGLGTAWPQLTQQVRDLQLIRSDLTQALMLQQRRLDESEALRNQQDALLHEIRASRTFRLAQGLSRIWQRLRLRS